MRDRTKLARPCVYCLPVLFYKLRMLLIARTGQRLIAIATSVCSPPFYLFHARTLRLMLIPDIISDCRR